MGRLPLSEFAQIFVAVVPAIGTAHAAGIVHRDLKPDNLFLVRLAGGAEEPRVVDFGIAKLTAIEGDAKQSGHLTTTGSVLGTPYYMSPVARFATHDGEPSPYVGFRCAVSEDELP